jgi:hypothetical protein
MIPFVPDPFPLSPFLHVNLHQAVEQQYLIDPVMRDVNPVGFFDLLLQMIGTWVMGPIGFENLLFGSQIDWLWFSSGLFEFRILLEIFKCGDELVYSLSCNLEIPGNMSNRLFILLLPNDSPDIPVR